MNKSDRDYLAFLTEEMPRLYQACKQDRLTLHETEWNHDDAPSVLGEAELRFDTIAGYATRFQNPNYTAGKDHERVLLDLYKASLYQSKTLLNWVTKNSQKHPDFTAYLEATELLLWMTVKVIRNGN